MKEQTKCTQHIVGVEEMMGAFFLTRQSLVFSKPDKLSFNTLLKFNSIISLPKLQLFLVSKFLLNPLITQVKNPFILIISPLPTTSDQLLSPKASSTSK